VPRIQTINGLGKLCVVYWTFSVSLPNLKKSFLTSSTGTFTLISLPVFINFAILNISGYNAFQAHNLFFFLTTRLSCIRTDSIGSKLDTLNNLLKPHARSPNVSYQKPMRPGRIKSILYTRLVLLNKVAVDVHDSGSMIFASSLGVLFIMFNAMIILQVRNRQLDDDGCLSELIGTNRTLITIDHDRQTYLGFIPQQKEQISTSSLLASQCIAIMLSTLMSGRPCIVGSYIIQSVSPLS
jgi:hypothetical protein